LETLSADIEPDSSSVSAVHRRSASVILSNVTLPQVGAFLTAWRQREPRWTVAKIDLSPVQPGRNDVSRPGGDSPIRAVLGLEMISVASGDGT
jgi:hypothetical protein